MDAKNHPIIPYEDVASVDCCGCLIVAVRGDQADITCNECGSIVRTVPTRDAAAVMNALMMEVRPMRYVLPAAPAAGR